MPSTLPQKSVQWDTKEPVKFLDDVDRPDSRYGSHGSIDTILRKQWIENKTETLTRTTSPSFGQGRDSQLGQGIDQRREIGYGQGRESRLGQGIDQKREIGYGQELGQGRESRLGQGIDQRREIGYGQGLGQGRESRLGQKIQGKSIFNLIFNL